MKKSFFLIPAFALALASCSSEAPILEDETYDGPLQTNYLTVNISDTGIMQTRAASDGEATDYEDGTTTENDVKGVRFYFFDAFGKAVRVSNALGTLNYYLDWDPSQIETDDKFNAEEKPNEEKRLTAQLIIKTPDGDRLPTSVAAVINPTDDVKSATITDISSLNNLVKNFSITTTSGGETSPFVMSNSVYAKDGETIDVVGVEGHIESTSTAAIDNPITLHVERVNAKVRLTLDSQLTSEGKGKEITGDDGSTFTIYDTGVENTSGDSNSKIYVKFIGWNVTCEPTKSRVMKLIDPTWTNVGIFGQDVWNWTSNSLHRSFWAKNPTLNYIVKEDDKTFDLANSDYKYGAFDHAQAIKEFDTDHFTYTQENASDNDGAPAHPTKVIIAAQLVDENGNDITLAEWGTNHYTVDGLLNNLASLANIYSITETQGDDGTKSTKHTKIDGTYFKFVSAQEAGKYNASDKGRYYAYIQLDPEKIKDLQLTDSPTGVAKDPSELNQALLNIDPAKVWKTGHTYYYFDIAHLGVTPTEEATTVYPGSFGVVRNHIYEACITSLAGLGTPVFNDDEVIVPEKPEKDQSFIAAQIHILSWRLVKKNIDLSW